MVTTTDSIVVCLFVLHTASAFFVRSSRQKREGIEEAFGVGVNAALQAADFFQKGVSVSESADKEIDVFGAKYEVDGGQKMGFGDAVRTPAADDDDDDRRKRSIPEDAEQPRQKRSPCHKRGRGNPNRGGQGGNGQNGGGQGGQNGGGQGGQNGGGQGGRNDDGDFEEIDRDNK